MENWDIDISSSYEEEFSELFGRGKKFSETKLGSSKFGSVISKVSTPTRTLTGTSFRDKFRKPSSIPNVPIPTIPEPEPVPQAQPMAMPQIPKGKGKGKGKGKLPLILGLSAGGLLITTLVIVLVLKKKK